MLTIEAGGRLDLNMSGDTSMGIHIVTPSCNVQTASPELFYHFKVPAGRRYGYDIRTMDYDTVVMLMNGTCAETATVANCNDDATPPGNLGSRIQGFVEEGDWCAPVNQATVVAHLTQAITLQRHFSSQ